MSLPQDTQLHPELVEKLHQLSEKYAAMGQDMTSYLDGLLQADYLTYWDYVHLETLLSLQNPRTAYPDELIFITYHQITELYFKLVKHEITQIGYHPALTAHFFTERMERINRYFAILEQSFAIMVEGMDKDQFLKFRMALLPSSGFQSVQFRHIEIMATHFRNLLSPSAPIPTNAPLDQLYEFIYWKQGATELATQQKTLTLKQFEKKYGDSLVRLATEYQSRNLYACWLGLAEKGEQTDALARQLRDFDQRVNVRWKLSHLRSAVRYLHKTPEAVAATGGTNWQRYLPPVEQQRFFFPDLWTPEERQNWGRSAG
ncbi:tryptophan 2,3-dioxygenase family protein [Rudanella lutea]|uniref:tryptophan 2,3-dioxygenase family protein n=1 Tax=Rudanella lutea TaxID=451374 RepID=UPI00039FE37E|nr:tryptophan 2,3-dioxygenase family protein [Rudanella lutea]